MKQELRTKVQAFITKLVEEKEFGGMYAPNVKIELRFWYGDPVTRMNNKFEIVSLKKQRSAQLVYRELWLSDEYKTWDFSLNRFCLTDAYSYLLNHLPEELGTTEVIKRLDCMLVRHHLVIEEAGKGNCGNEEYWREHLLEKFVTFSQKYGFLDPYKQYENSLPTTPEVLELLLYMAIALVRYEDEYSDDGKPLLKELAKKKYAPAMQCLETGTGEVPQQDAVWSV